MKHEIGTMLFRRKKASIRCGDLFIVVEQVKGGCRVLSFRKDGRVNTSWIEDEVLDKLYTTIGHTQQIDNWIYLAKRKDEPK